MTSPLGHQALDLDELAPVGRRLPLADRERVVARLLQAMWRRDRAVAEMRWAAITLTTMGLLGLLAKAIDPADPGFHRAITLSLPAALAAVAFGWTPSGMTVARSAATRWVLGPAVVLISIVAAAPMDVASLDIPAAGPLVVLALTFAAITRGFPVAAALVFVASAGVAVRHAQLVATTAPSELVSDEYVVQVAVLLLATTGMAAVVRIATAAEQRADRLAERRRRQVDDLEALGRILRRFDGSRSIREITQAVTDDLSRTFEIALISIYLPDAEGRLSMVGVAGYHSPFHVIDIGVGVIGRAASTRETQYVADVMADPDYKAARDDVRNEVAAPILLDDELIGVVNFEGTLQRPLGTRHVALAELVARTMAASLSQARHDEERRERLTAMERTLAAVSDAAVRDPLTGLLNRRYFDEAVETAFAAARRNGTALSLIVLDLDRFSAVNNEYGHAIGDAVLRRVADAMASTIRSGDVVVRYGGEEFVVIAPGADGRVAVEVAERIRAAVAASIGAVAPGALGADIDVRVSAGVASVIDEVDGHALFHAADSALLAAKRAGRDRVIAV
jgi:diguanylate cyclase (GGDEF)-like protein